MKKLVLLFLALNLLITAGYSQSSEVIKEYIETYKEVAILEMIRTGVPAAIKLAQGIHETGAGRSELASKSNNHFGIKCKSEWKGETVSHDDDARGECFRKYESPFQSYRDHSDFLKTRSHYASLFKLDPTDYEAWAFGLKKAGYATNPKYPQIIIKLIRDYNLQDYTLIAMGRKPDNNDAVWASTDKAVNDATEKTVQATAPKKQYPTGVFKINETNVVFVPAGTSYLAIAQKYDISLSRLFDFNELTGMEAAMQDQLVYLQRKRKQGATEFHVVEEGETLRDIAQTEGVRLESLLEYNHLKPGNEPKAGERLHLQDKSERMPSLAALFKSNKEEPKERFISSNYTAHLVAPKETLYSISKKYSVNVEEVMKWNNLQSPDLKIGQELRIYNNRNGSDQTAR